TPDLHSFPTRRSSDLRTKVYIPSQKMLAPAGFLRRFSWAKQVGALLYSLQAHTQERSLIVTLNHTSIAEALAQALVQVQLSLGRSEEHTSELQSPYDL